MSTGQAKKPRVEMTPQERMARDKRMAAAIAAGISADRFRLRFGCDPRREIPRICDLFKIKPRRERTKDWAY